MLVASPRVVAPRPRIAGPIQHPIFEASWTDVHFIIVKVALKGAVTTTHIACHLCVLHLLSIKVEEAVALNQRCLVNAPGALEAAKEVDYVARAHTLKEGDPSFGSIVARPDTIHTRSEPYSPSYSM